MCTSSSTSPAIARVNVFLRLPIFLQTLRSDLKLKMKDVEAKKQGTEILLEEMGVQRSEAEAQQVLN